MQAVTHAPWHKMYRINHGWTMLHGLLKFVSYRPSLTLIHQQTFEFYVYLRWWWRWLLTHMTQDRTCSTAHFPRYRPCCFLVFVHLPLFPVAGFYPWHQAKLRPKQQVPALEYRSLIAVVLWLFLNVLHFFVPFAIILAQKQELLIEVHLASVASKSFQNFRHHSVLWVCIG